MGFIPFSDRSLKMRGKKGQGMFQRCLVVACTGIGSIPSGKVASCSFCEPNELRPGCRIRCFSHSFLQQLTLVKAMMLLPEQGCDFGNTGGCFLFCLNFFKNLFEQFKNPTHYKRDWFVSARK